MNEDHQTKDDEILVRLVEVRVVVVVGHRNEDALRSRTTVAGQPVAWDNLLDDELKAVWVEVKYHRSLLVLSAWHC
jgi:hypothetical protein